MGVKEGEVDKESERKRVRKTERGGQRKLERMRYTYKKREVCNFKNIYYINVFTTISDWNGLYLHIASRSFLTSHLKTTLPTWIFFGQFPGH